MKNRDGHCLERYKIINVEEIPTLEKLVDNCQANNKKQQHWANQEYAVTIGSPEGHAVRYIIQKQILSEKDERERETYM